MNQVTQPITGFLNEIFQYLPRLIGPVLLVVIAWVVAKFLRIAAKRGMASTRFDERVEKEADLKSGDAGSLSNTVGETVYWLTFLVFLPAILSSLELGGLLGPVRGLVEKLLGYLPNLFAAGLILIIGWLVARIAILVLAGAMGLGEMGLGEDIIALAFGLTLGAVAVALAIAFGIGGRDAAAEIVSRWSRNAGDKPK